MSHQFQTGVFTYGEDPWHSLGITVPGGLNAVEAFRMAEADFVVESQSIFTPGGIEIPGYKSIVRMDSGFPLSVMSDTYKPLQNSNLLAIAEALDGQAQISAVCVLDEGRKVNFTAKINQTTTEVVKGDPVDEYIVGSTSHDGSLAFQVMFTPIRVVCNNTLTWALSHSKGRAAKSIKIKHTKMAERLISEIPAIMDVQRTEFTAQIDALKQLAKVKVSEQRFKAYVEACFADKLTGTINATRGDDTTARPKTVADLPAWEHIEGHFDCGLGMDIKGVKGTAWAAYNAVTQYLTHDAGRLLDPAEGARARLESLYWGENAQRNTRALELALAI